MDGYRKRKRDLTEDGDDSGQKGDKPFKKVAVRLSYRTWGKDSCSDLVSQSYNDLLVLPAAAVPVDLHEVVKSMLSRLRSSGLLLHDLAYISSKVITPPVKRVLFGKRGMTYRYLNLRLFAYPWEPYTMSAIGQSESHNWPIMTPSAYPEFNELCQFYKSVIHHHQTVIRKERCSCADHDFNVALINFWDPDDPRCQRLRSEPYFGMGEMAVSWHSDSGLVSGTPVAVYSHTVSRGERRSDSDDPLQDGPEWSVGFKIQWDTEGDGLCVPLGDGDSYVMLNKMNLTHQHCVVTGTEPRYSITYRKAVMDNGVPCWDSVHAMCLNALLPFYSIAPCPPSFFSSHLSPTKSDQTCHIFRESTNDRHASSMSSSAVPSVEEISDVIRDALFGNQLHVSSFLDLLSCFCKVEMDWVRQFWWQGAVRATTHHGFWLPRILWLEWCWTVMYHLLGTFFDVFFRDSNVKMDEYISTNASSFGKFSKALHSVLSAREDWQHRYSVRIFTEDNCQPIRWPRIPPAPKDTHPVHSLQLDQKLVLPWNSLCEQNEAASTSVFSNLSQLLSRLQSSLDNS